MTKRSWILAALVLGAAPAACEVTFGGPNDQGGTGNFSGAGASGFGGSGSGAGNGGGSVSGDQCNPVTGDGCPADGSTCDRATTGFFSCFPPPNTVDVCGSCDDATLFCGSDLTCVLPVNSDDGICYRYCCTDADCGAGGTCDTSFGAAVLQPANKGDAVGLCVTSTTDQGPACGPPATSPSGGACVGGFSGNPDGGSSTGNGGSSSAGNGGGPGDGGMPDDASAPDDGGDPFADGGHAGRHDGGHGMGMGGP